jgi:hypothetical protein
MSLESIVDKKLSCGGTGADTGTQGCQIEWGVPLHTIGMTKGFVIPKATVFNKAYIDAQIQLGNFIPAIGAETYEDQSGEDQVSTNARGVERLNVLGLPKYMFTYEEGHEFYKQMAKLTSFKALDWIFADEEGNWRLAINSDGDYTGFTAGQTIAMITKAKQLGGDSESKSLSIQLLNRKQWDQEYGFALRDQLTFAPEEIQGANGVIFSIDAAPTDTDTTMDFTAVYKADGLTPVEGLVLADVLFTVNGVDGLATALVENSPGQYTITVPQMGVGEVVGVQTFDAGVNKFVVINNGLLFRSNLATETVLA